MVAAFDGMLRGRAQVVSLDRRGRAWASRGLRQECFARLEAAGRLGVRDGPPRRLLLPGRAAVRGVFAASSARRTAWRPATRSRSRGEARGGPAALGGRRRGDRQRSRRCSGTSSGSRPPTASAMWSPSSSSARSSWRSAAWSSGGSPHGPLVLVVEDLHWADAASVELLQGVGRSAGRPPAPAPRDVSADVRARAWPRAGRRTRRSRVMPLSPADSESLLAAYFGDSTAGLPSRSAPARPRAGRWPALLPRGDRARPDRRRRPAAREGDGVRDGGRRRRGPADDPRAPARACGSAPGGGRGGSLQEAAVLGPGLRRGAAPAVCQ